MDTEMIDKSSLEQQVKTLTKEISKVELENLIFRKFVEKKIIELGERDEDGKTRKKNKKNLPLSLNIDQKIEIANIVHDEFTHEIEADKINSEKMLDTLRAVVEEAEIRISEIKRYAFEFKRDIMSGGVNKDKIRVEMIEHYFNEKLLHLDNTIEKLKLKNVSMKTVLHKLEQQVAMEDNHDSLHYIDFHQLQIENKQYLTQLNDKNEELIALKQSTAKIIQTLNDLKLDVTDKTEEYNWIQNEINNKEKIYDKLKKEKLKSTIMMKRQAQQIEKLQTLLTESSIISSHSNVSVNKSHTHSYQDIPNSGVIASNDNNNNNDDEGDKEGGYNTHISHDHTNNHDDDNIFGDDIIANEPSSAAAAAADMGVQSTTSTLRELPTLQDFIDQKRDMYQLQDDIRNWKRKLEIVELAAKNLKITL